jgi:hypothetical protein
MTREIRSEPTSMPGRMQLLKLFKPKAVVEIVAAPEPEEMLTQGHASVYSAVAAAVLVVLVLVAVMKVRSARAPAPKAPEEKEAPAAPMEVDETPAFESALKATVDTVKDNVKAIKDMVMSKADDEASPEWVPCRDGGLVRASSLKKLN